MDNPDSFSYDDVVGTAPAASPPPDKPIAPAPDLASAPPTPPISTDWDTPPADINASPDASVAPPTNSNAEPEKKEPQSFSYEDALKTEPEKGALFDYANHPISKELPATVTDIPSEIYNAGAAALSSINTNLNPFSESHQQKTAERVKADQGKPFWNMSSVTSGIGDVGSGLAAIPALVSSPLTGVQHSVGGHLLSAAEGIPYETAKSDVDTAMSALAPGRGGGIATVRKGYAPPAPPVEASGPLGVTLSEGQTTQSIPTIRNEQAALSGRQGAPAEDRAQQFAAQQKEQVEAAKGTVAQGLDQSGGIHAETPHGAASIAQEALQKSGQTQADALAAERESLAAPNKDVIHPHDAADTVAGELRGATERAQATADQRAQALTEQHENIRRDLGGGEVRANNLQEAAGVASDAITRAESEARAARDDAYGQLQDLPGEFQPEPFTRVGRNIRRSLEGGDDPVILDDRTTPTAIAAIRDVNRNLGRAAREAVDPEAEMSPPITPAMIDQARKRLVSLAKSANTAARASRDYSDVRAMGRVMDAFDDTVRGALADNYNGDGEAVGAAFDNARSLHSNLRRTFSSQGSGDKVGPIIEQILGRREGQEASAGQVANWLYGSGDTPVQVGRRLVNMFGTDSPEIGAIKQGLYSHLTERPEGVTAWDAGKVADRINEFLNGKGRSLAGTYLSQEERATLAQHAADLRGSIPAPVAPGDVVTRATNKIVGASGQTAATSEENASLLFGRTNVGDNATGVKLAQSIKTAHGENSPAFEAVRQGLRSRLAGAERGSLGSDPVAEAARLREFVNGSGKPMAEAAFTPDERAAMLSRADQLEAYAKKTAAPKSDVERAITRIRGGDGQPPATTTEVLDYLYGRSGLGDKGLSVRLAQRLKGEFGEASPQWSALKQGLFSRLVETPEGVKDWGPQQISQNISKFLNGNGKPLADAMLTGPERKMFEDYAELQKALVVPDAAANRSGTGHAVAPLLNKIGHLIGAGVGAYIGKHIPVTGAEYAGMVAGAAGPAWVGNKLAARAIAKQMPLITEAAAKYQRAAAMFEKANTPLSQAALTTAAANLTKAAARIGVNSDGDHIGPKTNAASTSGQ